MTLSPSLVFAPVDGDEASLAAVEYAAAIAAEYDATLHVLYVAGTDLARAVDDGAVDDADVAAEVERYLQSVADVADDAGVPLSTSMAAGFSTQRLSRHPGRVVLDTAEECGADFLVVPREAGVGTDATDDRTDVPAPDAADVLAKAAEYVLLYAPQPVLSV